MAYDHYSPDCDCDGCNEQRRPESKAVTYEKALENVIAFCDTYVGNEWICSGQPPSAVVRNLNKVRALAVKGLLDAAEK